MEADHIVPLCLARTPAEYKALDVLDNIQMQTCDRWEKASDGVPVCEAGVAWRKDQVEKSMCEAQHKTPSLHDGLVTYFRTYSAPW
jgi:hypothetical protein